MGDEQQSKRVVSGHGRIEMPSVQITATASVRHNMALQHLNAAGYFCRRVEALQDEHAGIGWGPHCVEIQWNFSACVMASIASLEAFCNETVENIGFDEEYHALIERKGLVDKFYFILKLSGKDTLDKGGSSANAIRTLMELRNAFVHFRPEWSDKAGRSEKLETKLPKLAQSPFCGPGDQFFPMRCVSSAYAWWAVESTYAFLDDFSTRIGERLRFRKRDQWGMAK